MGFESCRNGEALVINGCFCFSRPRIVKHGRVMVWPGQSVQRLDLSTSTLTVETKQIPTLKNIPLNVVSVAQVRLNGRDPTMFERACENFLGREKERMEEFAIEVIERHQRSTIGRMTVEDIYSKRKEFCLSVFENATPDLEKWGISFVSYTLKDVTDDAGYLKAMGEARMKTQELQNIKCH